MKIKKIIKKIKKAQKADDKLFGMLNESLYDQTAGLVYGQLWDAYLSLVVGDDWDWYADQVGNAVSAEGGFIVDRIVQALCYDFNAEEVESLVSEGWAVIFEQSIEPEIDYKEFTDEQ